MEPLRLDVAFGLITHVTQHFADLSEWVFFSSILTACKASLVQGPRGCLSFPSVAHPQELGVINLQKLQEGYRDVNKTPAVTRAQGEMSVAHPPFSPPGQEKGNRSHKLGFVLVVGRIQALSSWATESVLHLLHHFIVC